MSKYENCLERVEKALRTCKQIQGPIGADSLLEELGIDSLDVLMLVGELEEEFDISIDQDSFAGVATVGDIVARLEE